MKHGSFKSTAVVMKTRDDPSGLITINHMKRRSLKRRMKT